MKSKAKPAKGSARTKRFDVGGTVGALAGLGTLAYLLSRKKKDATGAESGGMSKDPNAPSVADRLKDKAENNDSKVVKPPPGVIFEEDRAKEKDRMDSAVETHRRITSGNAPVVKKKPVIKNVVKKVADGSASTTNQGSSTNTGVDAGIAAGNKKADSGGFGTVTKLDDNSPQAKAIKAQRDERTRQKFLQSRAGLSGKGITTPGDPNKKEATLEPSARTKNVIKAVQGTLDNAGKSTVRSDTDKMRERALEVERRRKEEKAAKQGYGIKKGGMVKKYANGGSVMASKMGSVKTAKPSMRSASSRADGIAQRGKTRA